MECVICKKQIQESRYNKAILCSDECFHENFWNEKLAWKLAGDPNQVIIKHTHWHISPDSPGSYFKGMGGRQFKIKFHDGREVTTRNLWCQGNVPEKFWDRLPDNAIFI